MTDTTRTQTPTTSRSDNPLRYAVIAASLRKDRVSRALAEWVAEQWHTPGTLDLIDLAEVDLPDDGLLQPGGGPASEIAHRVEDADGYVIVTPEYNHSYPAGLKRAIDWHYSEWQLKAATVVSYGVLGGALATEHLRHVFAELNVVTTRRAVGLPQPWARLDDDGFRPDEGEARALRAALDELAWWGQTLRDARRERPFPR